MKSLSLYTVINTTTVLYQNAAIYDNALKQQDKIKSHLQI